MILNVKFNDLKKFERLKERMLAYCKKENGINVLLDNGNMIFQSFVTYDEILNSGKYGNSKEEAINLFIRSELEREECIEYFEFMPESIPIEEQILVKLQEVNPENSSLSYDKESKVLYITYKDGRKEPLIKMNY